MVTKNEFQHESVQDNETISQYLKALMDGFATRQIMFDTSEKQMVLHPNNLIEFEIKAKQKNGKNKVSLKFAWKDVPIDQQEGKSLEISST